MRFWRTLLKEILRGRSIIVIPARFIPGLIEEIGIN